MPHCLMLHWVAVAQQGGCLPFWETLQLVAKELVSGRRQRGGGGRRECKVEVWQRQSKRKQQRQRE